MTANAATRNHLAKNKKSHEKLSDISLCKRNINTIKQASKHVFRYFVKDNQSQSKIIWRKTQRI